MSTVSEVLHRLLIHNLMLHTAWAQHGAVRRPQRSSSSAVSWRPSIYTRLAPVDSVFARVLNGRHFTVRHEFEIHNLLQHPCGVGDLAHRKFLRSANLPKNRVRMLCVSAWSYLTALKDTGGQYLRLEGHIAFENIKVRIKKPFTTVMILLNRIFLLRELFSVDDVVQKLILRNGRI